MRASRRPPPTPYFGCPPDRGAWEALFRWRSPGGNAGGNLSCRRLASTAANRTPPSVPQSGIRFARQRPPCRVPLRDPAVGQASLLRRFTLWNKREGNWYRSPANRIGGVPRGQEMTIALEMREDVAVFRYAPEYRDIVREFDDLLERRASGRPSEPRYVKALGDLVDRHPWFAAFDPAVLPRRAHRGHGSHDMPDQRDNPMKTAFASACLCLICQAWLHPGAVKPPPRWSASLSDYSMLPWPGHSSSHRNHPVSISKPPPAPCVLRQPPDSALTALSVIHRVPECLSSLE